MSTRLEKLWDRAARWPGTNVDLGNLVVCDFCTTDYTDRDDEGGFMFSDKAVCPACAPRVEREAKEYREDHLIRVRCPTGKSFADWVRDDVRQPGENYICINTPDRGTK